MKALLQLRLALNRSSLAGSCKFFSSRFRQVGSDGQRESLRCPATGLRQEAEEPTGRYDDGRLHRGVHQTQDTQAGHVGGAEKCIPRRRTGLAIRHSRRYAVYFGNERESVSIKGNLRGPGTFSEQFRSHRRDAEVIFHVSDRRAK